MKIYIAGQITDDPNYGEHFRRAEYKLMAEGYTAVNPTRLTNILPADKTAYEDFIKVSQALLNVCDGIYMLDHWQKSKGAKLEYAYAVAMGMPIMYESENG